MSIVRLRLEDFAPERSAPDAPAPASTMPDGAALEAARNEGYARGFRDGAARATEAVDAQKQRIDMLAETIADARITRASARAEVIASFDTLFAAFTREVLPAAARDGFPALLAERVAAALSGREDPLTVEVAPAERAAIASTLADMDGMRLVAAEDLAPGSARLRGAGAGFTAIDINRALGAIVDATEAFFLTPPDAPPNREGVTHETG